MSPSNQSRSQPLSFSLKLADRVILLAHQKSSLIVMADLCKERFIPQLHRDDKRRVRKMSEPQAGELHLLDPSLMEIQVERLL